MKKIITTFYLACMAMAASAVEPIYVQHNKVRGTTPVMTNMQAWASSVSTASVATNISEKVAKAMKPVKIGSYVWKVGTEGENWVAATNRYAKAYPSYGACTGVKAGNLHGRNLDWEYDHGCTIIVMSPAQEGKYAVIGASDGLRTLTDDFMMSEKWDDAYYALPFTLSDGINEHGVVIQQNIIQKNVAKSSSWRSKRPGCVISFAIIRYALDRCSTARQAADMINDKNFVPSEFAYDFHYMVSDKTSSFIVEDGQVYASPAVATDLMTNFRIGGTSTNANGTVKWNTVAAVDPYGIGLERYDRIRTNGFDKTTLAGMATTMKDVWYTKAYDPATTPAWNTEFCSPGTDRTVINAQSNPSVFDSIKASEYIVYTNEHDKTSQNYRGGHSWQTTHTAIYDKGNLSLRLWTQEDNNSECLFYLKKDGDYKQDKLPYATNAIPSSAIADSPWLQAWQFAPPVRKWNTYQRFDVVSHLGKIYMCSSLSATVEEVFNPNDGHWMDFSKKTVNPDSSWLYWYNYMLDDKFAATGEDVSFSSVSATSISGSLSGSISGNVTVGSGKTLNVQNGATFTIDGNSFDSTVESKADARIAIATNAVVDQVHRITATNGLSAIDGDLGIYDTDGHEYDAQNVQGLHYYLNYDGNGNPYWTANYKGASWDYHYKIRFVSGELWHAECPELSIDRTEAAGEENDATLYFRAPIGVLTKTSVRKPVRHGSVVPSYRKINGIPLTNDVQLSIVDYHTVTTIVESASVTNQGVKSYVDENFPKLEGPVISVLCGGVYDAAGYSTGLSGWKYIQPEGRFGMVDSNPLSYKVGAYLDDISHTNVRFSNEVLSVALNIDTNLVAVIGEFKESWGDFPLSPGQTSATLVGLLGALAAAIAWLKKNKLGDTTADYAVGTTYSVGNFCKHNGTLYSCNTAHTATNWETDSGKWTSMASVSQLFTEENTSLMGVARYSNGGTSSSTMADRTTNVYTLNAPESSVTLAFPSEVEGKMRDFLLDLTYTAGTLQLPDGVTKVGDDLTFTAGKEYLLSFTEISANRFYVRSIEIA